MTPEERQEFNDMKEKLDKLMKSDRYVFERDIEMSNGRNFQFGTDYGNIIATEPTQKLSFYGQTPPVVQPSAPALPTGGATIDSQARTWITACYNRMSNHGLWASLP